MGERDIRQMLDAMCRAVEARDGKTFASYFAEDGVYHDDFYGAFAGRERVAELIDKWFYKDARNFRWDMLDPAYEAGRLYTRYIFSYDSTLPEAQGARTMFEGVSMMRLRDGEIVEYREIINSGTAFADMKFHPERIAKIFARKAAEMKERPDVRQHMANVTSARG